MVFFRLPGRSKASYSETTFNRLRLLILSKWNLLVLVDPSLLQLGPARFTALRISALVPLWTSESEVSE